MKHKPISISKSALHQWQLRAKNHEPLKVQLAKLPTLASNSDDEAVVEGWKAQTKALAKEIADLQQLLYANGNHKLLVVLQGMDTSGKDGTIRHVFRRVTPLGVRAVSFKAPDLRERAHDFLWRVHSQVPGDGETVIFNRSQYEDVLVPVVLGQIDRAQTEQRYAQINSFEQLLAGAGTVIVKCMLHISKDVQRERLQARLDDREKRWKFDSNDLTVRAQWDAYQEAYQALLRATSTEWAPWNVVPSDCEALRNCIVATLVRDALKNLNMRTPPAKEEVKDVVVK